MPIPIEHEPALIDAYRTVESRCGVIAYRVLGNASDAQDCLQSAFLKVWQTATHADGIRALLFRATHDCAVDMLRKRHREEALPDVVESIKSKRKQDKFVTQTEPETLPASLVEWIKSETTGGEWLAVGAMLENNGDVELAATQRRVSPGELRKILASIGKRLGAKRKHVRAWFGGGCSLAHGYATLHSVYSLLGLFAPETLLGEVSTERTLGPDVWEYLPCDGGQGERVWFRNGVLAPRTTQWTPTALPEYWPSPVALLERPYGPVYRPELLG